MASLLIALIYLSFISLGLPDSLLGSAWPVMRLEFGASLSMAGMISMIIAGGTIISSLLSDRLTRKFGTGTVNAVSVCLTAVALFGFSVSDSILLICLCAIPYGLGAGAVDAALNNYVALHYSGRHMSWLHCFWGVGALISPYIMSYCLSAQHGWRVGYRTVSLIQFALTVVLIATLFVWKRPSVTVDFSNTGASSAKPIGVLGALRLRGVPYILIAFFGECALECTAGLWASSYLVEYRGVDAQTAALFASLYYVGMTLGRFLNGFIADRLSDRTLIRIGLCVMACGIGCMLLPGSSDIPTLTGLVTVGVGCAPVYPCIIHSTPSNFGREHSQSIVGIQMASAYMGSTLMPPLFGVIAGRVGIFLYPVFLALFVVLMTVMTELLNRKIARFPTI